MTEIDGEDEMPLLLMPCDLMGNIYAQLFCAYTQDPERDKEFSDSKKFEDMLAISQDVALNADMPDVALELSRREFRPHETFHLLRQALVDNIGEEALKKNGIAPFKTNRRDERVRG